MVAEPPQLGAFGALLQAALGCTATTGVGGRRGERGDLAVALPDAFVQPARASPCDVAD